MTVQPIPAGREDAPTDGRVAVVSGANRGLGLRIVRLLADRGMRVVLASRSIAKGQAAVERLGDLGHRVAVRQLDVTDPASVVRLVEWVGWRLGRCDVLVNNATAGMEDPRGAGTVDLSLVRRMLDTDLLGTWRLTQAVLPLMRHARYGRVVNVCGGQGRTAGGVPAARVSRCALSAMTRMVADEVAPDRILVNACCRDTWWIEVPARSWGPADTAAWLATLPDGGPTGGFYYGRKRVSW